MNFLKKLFSKEEEEPFVPTPTQQVSGLEPIVVQAVENLFPNEDDQKELLDGLQKRIQNTDTLVVLALLSMIKVDDVKASKDFVLDNISAPMLGTNHNYFIMRDCDFKDMKGAQKWVKSITKS